MNNNLKNDVLISYFSMIVTIIITFFLTKIQVKYLGEDMFGILGLVNSTIGYISIMELGVGQTVIKYLAEYKNEKKLDSMYKLLGHSLKTYFKIMIVGLFIGIIIVCFSSKIFNSISGENIIIFNICFVLALINVLLQIPATTFYSVLSAYNDFKFFKIITILRAIMKLIVIYILLILGFGIVSIFVAVLILTQLSNIVICFYSIKKYKIKISFETIDYKIRKELSNYSFFVFLFLITDQIFWKTDSILLGMISTTSIVAVYSISGQIIMQLRQLSATFSSVFLTRIVDKINNKNSLEEINKFYILASKYQYMIISIIVISYIGLGKQFLTLWVGENFVMAYYYSLVIILATFIPMSQTTLVQILYALNKHRVRSVIYLICAIINIFLSIILYNLIGPIGVALATAVAMFICDNLFINIYYRCISGFKFVDLFKKAFLKTTIVSITTLIFYLFLNKIVIQYSWVGLIVKGTLGCGIYLLLIYKFVLDEDEKEFIKNNYLKKLLK